MVDLFFGIHASDQCYEPMADLHNSGLETNRDLVVVWGPQMGE
jgi:hypothetical protein